MIFYTLPHSVHSSVWDGTSPDWRVPTRSYGTSNPSWSNIERRTTKHNYKDNSGVGNSGAGSNKSSRYENTPKIVARKIKTRMLARSEPSTVYRPGKC